MQKKLNKTGIQVLDNEPKLERWQKIKAFLEDDSIPNNTMFTLADAPDYHQTKVGLAFAVRALKQK